MSGKTFCLSIIIHALTLNTVFLKAVVALVIEETPLISLLEYYWLDTLV